MCFEIWTRIFINLDGDAYSKNLLMLKIGDENILLNIMILNYKVQTLIWTLLEVSRMSGFVGVLKIARNEFNSIFSIIYGFEFGLSS